MARLKLTTDKIKLLETYVKLGLPMNDIFAACRVPSSTYYRWMSIGRAVAEDNLEHLDIPKQPTRKEGESKRKYNRRLHRYQQNLQLYARLHKKMEAAVASAIIDMVLVIRSAALTGKWRAARYFLERRDPHNWNLKTILRAEATVDERDQHQELQVGWDVYDLTQMLRANEERQAEEDGIRARAASAPAG